MASVKSNPFRNKRTTVKNSPLTPGFQAIKANNDWAKQSAADMRAYEAARTYAPNLPGKGNLRLWARGPGTNYKIDGESLTYYGESKFNPKKKKKK